MIKRDRLTNREEVLVSDECCESELSDVEQFVSDIGEFFNSEQLSDVTILVKSSDTGATKQFNAHRFVLAKSSEFFKALLYSDNWKPGVGILRELIEDEICYSAFEPFLQFLYTGRVTIQRDSAVGLLRLSDKYAIRSLRTMTEAYMMRNAESPRVQNALLWYSWAKQLCMTELAGVCFNTISWNVKRVIELSEFLDSDCNFVTDLLESDDLVIEHENAVLNQLLLPWLSVGNRFSKHAGQLLPMIRFPMMTAKQLFDLEESELLRDTCECRDLMQQLIHKAYRFRSLCPWLIDSDVQFNEACYRPRNYLSLDVDTVKVGNTVRFGFQVDVRSQAGSVSSSSREADWKIVYQKSGDSWSIKLMSQDSSVPVGGSTIVQLIVLARSDSGSVVQRHQGVLFTFTRSSQLYPVTCDIPRSGGPHEAKSLQILLKQFPASGAPN